MSIQVTIKQVYGNELIYPACPKAHTFATMLGQSTLTRRDIASIKALGFTVNVTPSIETVL